MFKLFYLGFFGLMAFAIANTSAKFQHLNKLDHRQEQVEGVGDKHRVEVLKNKFDLLRHKSLLLDNSVDTNDKLRYLTHSDNFEEALFLIEYLHDRFDELDLADSERREIAFEDIEFYIERLEQNLDVVQRELKSFTNDDDIGD
ncbi:MAG: hypothetical protein KC478_17200 [Bacteriovoracaceae bacterium]|nr:hypothetical protein [Bacteriovoracaceae bacterium]